MLHFLHVELLSCCTFFILPHFHVALFCVVIFSCCTLFRVALFLCIALFHVALLHVAMFSFSILLLLHSSHVGIFSCCTLFMLHYFQRGKQDHHKDREIRKYNEQIVKYCWKYLHLRYSRSPYYAFTISTLHFFHVPLFSCCTLFMFHFFNIEKYW